MTVKCVDSFGHSRVLEHFHYRPSQWPLLLVVAVFIVTCHWAIMVGLPIAATLFLVCFLAQWLYSFCHSPQSFQPSSDSTNSFSAKRITMINSVACAFFVQCDCEGDGWEKDGQRVVKITLWQHQFKDADYRRLLALLNLYQPKQADPSQEEMDLKAIWLWFY